MIFRLDVVKVLWHIAWAVAWWRGELPWWALVGVLCCYWQYHYTFISRKTRKEIAQAQQEQASQVMSQLFAQEHGNTKAN